MEKGAYPFLDLAQEGTWIPFTFDPAPFYVGNDQDWVGTYSGLLWRGWRDWSTPLIEANRATDGHRFLADFELKILEANPVLQDLGAGIATSVDFFHLAGREVRTHVAPGFQVTQIPVTNGDGIVTVESATRGHDASFCSQVIDVEFKPTKPILHNWITQVGGVRDSAFEYLAGMGPSTCNAQASTLQSATEPPPPAPSLEQQWVLHPPPSNLGSGLSTSQNASTLGGITPMVPPTFTMQMNTDTASSASTSGTTTLAWNVTSAANALFRLQGANGTLSSLNVSIVAPNGTTISMDGPTVGWVNWTTSIGRGGHDEVQVFVDAPGNGLWTVQAEGHLDTPMPLWGEVFLDSTLRLEQRFEPQGTASEQKTLEAALLNGTTPTPGASVEGIVYDPTLNQTIHLTFHDDGTDHDATAADGVYTATYLPLTPGEHQYRLTATLNDTLRVFDGVIPILAHERLDERSCAVLAIEGLSDEVSNGENIDPSPLASCLETEPSVTPSSLP